MKIAVLTSSRADYGIYQPLLRRLSKDPYFDLELIVFGTHLSQFYGYTANQIKDDGFNIAHEVESLILGDSEEAIASAIAHTASKFSGIWASVNKKYDLIFCLGDRYEMFAAVASAVPFNLTFAHIHGGEETKGAIDNIFRHSITHMSKYHFTTTERYKSRVLQLLDSDGSKANVFHVGSLSLDNLDDINLLDTTEFADEYGINLNEPTILFTFHPETVYAGVNKEYISEIIKALESLANYQIVVTMPNADTKGEVIRDSLNKFIINNKERVWGVENFGTRGYFSCMNQCSFLMGNSSSGIIEAASFGKYVLNLGDRQRGRASGRNVLNIEIGHDKIISAVRDVESLPDFSDENIYWNGGAANQIVKVLKEEFI